MKLTGKCKEEFEKWFEPPLDENAGGWDIVCYGDATAEFYQQPEAMRFGVLEDYFDSVGVDIPTVSKGWECFYTNYKGIHDQYKTRPEARTKAIIKADEIRNEQLKTKQQ